MFKKPEIKRLNNCISNNSNWCRDAIAFEVKNGLGKLVHAENGCNSQLLLNGKPLIQGRYLASPTMLWHARHRIWNRKSRLR